ncbi:MAG: polyprenyl synthetase family protein [Candidatus Microsaccharimonas sp.]
MESSVSLLDQTAVKELVDTHIRYYCEERKNQAKPIGERYVVLWDAIQSLVLAGGKRLRPYMVVNTYFAYAKNPDITTILPAAVAQELLHAAMLMHDDIIDKDLIRYGVKNIAGQYRDIYAPLINDEQEKNHLSLSAAILAGDMLLSDAHRLLKSVNLPAELVIQADEILSNGIFEVIGGELLDSEVAMYPVGTITAETIAKYKTASYSFVSPLTMGAVLAGASEKEIHLLTQLSEHLGIGYQLRDDILGMFGDSAKTGKSTSTDIIEGKRTMLVEAFDRLANPVQKQRFYELFHNPKASIAELQEVRTLIETAGAKADIERTIFELEDKAFIIVDQLAISEEHKQAFYELLRTSLKRDI